jgi:hypothetical protein
MTVFVIRMDVDEAGDAIGVVERVRTGEKERFREYDMLADVVRRMTAAHADRVQDERL